MNCVPIACLQAILNLNDFNLIFEIEKCKRIDIKNIELLRSYNKFKSDYSKFHKRFSDLFYSIDKLKDSLLFDNLDEKQKLKINLEIEKKNIQLNKISEDLNVKNLKFITNDLNLTEIIEREKGFYEDLFFQYFFNLFSYEFSRFKDCINPVNYLISDIKSKISKEDENFKSYVINIKFYDSEHKLELQDLLNQKLSKLCKKINFKKYLIIHLVKSNRFKFLLNNINNFFINEGSKSYKYRINSIIMRQKENDYFHVFSLVNSNNYFYLIDDKNVSIPINCTKIIKHWSSIIIFEKLQ